MAESLEAAGILEPWAETLHEQALEVAELNHRAGMTASEAESEARKDLLPCSWEAQELWLASAALDYEPVKDPDLYDPADENGEAYGADPGGIPLLLSEPGELYIVKEKLTSAIRAALKRRKLPARLVMELGSMLSLVERLPEHHEEFTAKLDLTKDMGEDAEWTCARIDDRGLTLEVGEIFRGGCGSDHSSEIVYQATRQGSTSSDVYFDLTYWLNRFIADAEDPDVELTVEWYPELEIPGG